MAESTLVIVVRRVAGWFTPIINLERIAYILHRITGFYLAIYLPLHIISTHNSLNPIAWEKELILYSSLPIKIGEIFLVFSIFFHGLNGLRLLLVEYFNIFLPKKLPSSLYLERTLSIHNPQKTFLYLVIILSILLTILGTLYLFNILVLR